MLGQAVTTEQLEDENMIAIGSDHCGYELKKKIEAYLDQRKIHTRILAATATSTVNILSTVIALPGPWQTASATADCCFAARALTSAG